jgi:hypothetical protein
MVQRIAEVTSYKRKPDGTLISSETKMANIAAPPAVTVEDWRKRAKHVLNVLGPSGYSCPENTCEGCNYERDEAIRHLLDALDCETYEDFRKSK